MRFLRNGERGQILALVLILLGLAALLVVPMLQISYTSQKYHQMVEVNTLKAYAADSGIEYGRYQIYNYPAELQQSPLRENLVIGDVDVYVTIEYVPAMAAYKIVSNATRAQASVTIECVIVIDVGLFSNIVACDGDLVIDHTDLISTTPGECDIYTHGNIELIHSTVDGDAKASGIVTLDHSTVTGDIIEGAEVLQFPAIGAQIHEGKAKAGGTHSGDLTLSGGTRHLGPSYIDGNLVVNSGADLLLEGTVYVTGDVGLDHCNITGFGDVIAEGNLHMDHYSLNVDEPQILPLFFSVHKSVSIDHDDYSGSSGTQVVLYAPDGKIVLDHVDLYGSVAAQLVEVKQARINYPAELRGRADLPGAGFDTVTYTFK